MIIKQNGVTTSRVTYHRDPTGRLYWYDENGYYMYQERWLSRSKIKRFYTRSWEFNKFCEYKYSRKANKVIRGISNADLVKVVNEFLEYNNSVYRIRIEPTGPIADKLFKD